MLPKTQQHSHISSFHFLLPIIDVYLFGVVLLFCCLLHCDKMHLSPVWNHVLQNILQNTKEITSPFGNLKHIKSTRVECIRICSHTLHTNIADSVRLTPWPSIAQVMLNTTVIKCYEVVVIWPIILERSKSPYCKVLFPYSLLQLFPVIFP